MLSKLNNRATKLLKIKNNRSQDFSGSSGTSTGDNVDNIEHANGIGQTDHQDDEQSRAQQWKYNITKELIAAGETT